MIIMMIKDINISINDDNNDDDNNNKKKTRNTIPWFLVFRNSKFTHLFCNTGCISSMRKKYNSNVTFFFYDLSPCR